MPWQGAAGSQNYVRSDGVRTGTDVYQQQDSVAIGVEAVWHDATEQDLATALDLCLKKDGGNKPSADIDWGGFKITNLGAPTADNDAVRRAYAEANLTLPHNELTIASGVVTPTGSSHSIDTEADAATDNLDQIVTSNMRSGQILELWQESGARDVTVRNAQGGAGQIHTRFNRDIQLSTENPLVLQLVYGVDWYEVVAPQVSRQPELLDSQTAANDPSINFESLMTTDHQMVQMRLMNVVPATDNAVLYLRLADSGTTWATSAYAWSRYATSSNAVAAPDSNNADARFQLATWGIGSVGAETGISGEINIYTPMSSAYTHIEWRMIGIGSDGFTYHETGGGLQL